MTRYYPASSQPAGKALSEAMWQLCLPLDQRQPNDTNQAFEVLRGANGQTYVNMPDDFAAALHPEADAAPWLRFCSLTRTPGMCQPERRRHWWHG